MTAYIQIPDEILQVLKSIRSGSSKDRFGVISRSRFIESSVREFLAKKGGETENSGIRVIDLGGNSGYFSYSLLKSNLVDQAVIYDTNKNYLEIGRVVSVLGGIENRMQFKQQKIDIDFLRDKLLKSDIILANNLFHHAGYLFDNDVVEREGWGEYMSQILEIFHEKCDFLVLGLGFKESLPKFWLEPKFFYFADSRANEFEKIINGSKWNLATFARVDEISTDGKAQKSTSLLDNLPKVLISQIDLGLKFIIRLRAWFEEKTGVALRTRNNTRTHKYWIYVLSKGS